MYSSWQRPANAVLQETVSQIKTKRSKERKWGEGEQTQKQAPSTAFFKMTSVIAMALVRHGHGNANCILEQKKTAPSFLFPQCLRAVLLTCKNVPFILFGLIEILSC